MKTIPETATEINNAKDAFIKRYGNPDIYRDDDASGAYIVYNIQRPGGVQGEVELVAKISKNVRPSRMTGLLQIELADKTELLRQQAQWIRKDAELKAKKNIKLHF